LFVSNDIFHRYGDTMKQLCITVLLLGLVGCGGSGSSSGAGSDAAPTPQLPDDTTTVEDLTVVLQDLNLTEFFDTANRALLLRNPETIIELGLEDVYELESALLTTISDSYTQVTYEMVEVILQRLEAYDRNALDPADQLSYDIYHWYLDDTVREQQYLLYSYPISASGWSVEYQIRLFFADLHPLQDRQDADNFITRLRLVDDKIDQLIDNLQARENFGVIAPDFILQMALNPIQELANGTSDSSIYYTAFRDRLDLIAALDQSTEDELLQSARQAITNEVIPAYGELATYLNHLISVAPAGISVGQFDGGEEYYQHLLRHHTSTDLNSTAIHQLGLQELTRIHAEMRSIFNDLGYPDNESLTQSFARVAADSGSVNAANVVTTYEILISEALQALHTAFNSVPDTEIIVIGGSVGGFYVAGSLDGSRPAAFYATVSGSEPSYQMPSLSYHETVPGHHLQISLAQQLQLPEFRTGIHFSSYVEGWALYAERLASDLGWYADDQFGDLGRLQWESLRATRLVVDTGIHAQGWTFDRAVDFFIDNTGFSTSFAQGQISRYAIAPGQATAYMIGMLKILELRQQATEQLGELFDLKEFHDAVLNSGAVPMSLLEQGVNDYIASKLAQ